MINLLVDEAYAFDYIAILQIKLEKGAITRDFFDKICQHIVNQITMEKYLDIVFSPEFSDLCEANKKTFEAVDLAKTDAVSARYVDDCNYHRMICKKKLQEKFFSEGLTEKKVGYT